MFISLPFGTSLTILLGFLSAVLIAVAFRHLATKSSFYFACFYLYFAVFWRRGHCSLAAIVFAAWVAVPFFASLRHFYHFVAVHPDSHGFLSFVGLPFLLWSCRCLIHLAAKDAFIVTTGRRLVFVVLVIFSSLFLLLLFYQ